jgi:hypothetical protein
MEHRITVARRFDADDWRPWERIGIRAIVQQLCPSVSPQQERPAVPPQQECPAVSPQE